MKQIILTLSYLLTTMTVLCQQPKDGSYTYKIAFAEWEKQPAKTTCTVIIKGDSIKIIHNGNPGLTGKKGDIIDQGLLLRHKATGKWIIAHDQKDSGATEVGGCSDGPAVIDIKRRVFWLC